MPKKNELRQQYRKKRSLISPKSSFGYSKAIITRIKSESHIEGTTIMLYMSNKTQHELPTTFWFDLLIEYNICVPKITGSSNKMEAVLWDNKMTMITNAWGIQEPEDTTVVIPKNINTIVVPLLCFDLNGHRVGYGKGFYDRFLSRCSPCVKTIGVSMFDPIDKIDGLHRNDYSLNLVVTPKKTYTF
jgi:5-formyltetrahydrofolate cyclo-ligase